MVGSEPTKKRKSGCARVCERECGCVCVCVFGVCESVRVVVVFLVTTIHTALIFIRTAYDLSILYHGRVYYFATHTPILEKSFFNTLQFVCRVYATCMAQSCLNTIK